VDALSIIGIVIALVAIVGGNLLEGGHMGMLANGPAAVIVIGGTIGAALLQTPMAGVRRAMEIARWVIFPPQVGFQAGISLIVRWAQTARKEGLLGLEGSAEVERNEFARKGLQLLVDGHEPESIRTVLQNESDMLAQRDIDAARFFECMGGYAPTIGIIGAVLGLIHVMGNLADPSKLGPGIAVAFVATIYGVAVANLLFLPMAAKLKACVREAARFRAMLIEGIIAIADGENPRTIERKLAGYIHR
jgi:chemotaxis protein MotA